MKRWAVHTLLASQRVRSDRIANAKKGRNTVSSRLNPQPDPIKHPCRVPQDRYSDPVPCGLGRTDSLGGVPSRGIQTKFFRDSSRSV